MKKRIWVFAAILLLAAVLWSAASAEKVIWKEHTYELVFEKISWTEAEAECEKKGGHLVTITSASEQKFIYKEIMKNEGEVFWIGLSEVGGEGNWEWVTGERLSYTNWAWGQPDNEYNANCGCIYTTYEDWGMNPGEWDDAEDTGYWCNYICEWDYTEEEDALVTYIRLNKTKATLKKGKTLQLKVKEILPEDAENKKVKWTSSNKKIATVDKNGKVKAKKKGSCMIYCTATDGSGTYAYCKITVK